MEEQRVNIIGDFVDKPTSFGDAYRVDVQIIIWNQANVLKVPLSSLFRCGQSWCTFTVKDGKANRQQIEIGQRSDFEAEVRRGLQEGEVLILHPSEQIDHGKRVRFCIPANKLITESVLVLDNLFQTGRCLNIHLIQWLFNCISYPVRIKFILRVCLDFNAVTDK